MTDYVWQLGIDWNAIQTGGVGYLRGGLLKDGVLSSGTSPVQTDDRITFRIFDVTSPVPPSTSPPGRCVAEIVSLGIDSQAAVKGQPSVDPLDNNHPAVLSPPVVSAAELALQSSLFGPPFCSWDSQPVTVTAPAGRFLLTVYLQALGLNGVTRLFNHDPEMIIGEHG